MKGMETSSSSKVRVGVGVEKWAPWAPWAPLYSVKKYLKKCNILIFDFF